MNDPQVTLEREQKIAPDVADLLKASDDYFAGLYPPESNHLVEIAELEQPDVYFYVARLNGQAVGCGGFLKKDGYGEIKRLFVSPEGRGHKIGRRLMEMIEAGAREVSLTQMKLEMGPSQPEAQTLYESFGYKVCPPFGDYQEDPYSVFMERML